MEQDNNPFAYWQQWWQDNPPPASSFLPPTNLEELNKRLIELDNIEMWLSMQLQGIQWQKTLLNQQKLWLSSWQKANESETNQEQ
ncbi:PhaM family polyhydroxyalkanoate granule multifunctional regulatory protein [Stenoxybacter acetivorans]|uniref:PhaM family polyhydroxyalkanoate granule multifunctional regulatory protein n=1 Tax=Stenoxybacter acetivorans TaxID=422441 RepID=UPI0005658381|nr:PhaM family polyhydroxyalkanoate granule multifunctional regulatory protein [Stenoxybacter acetivorans]